MRLKEFSPFSKDPDALQAFHFERNIGTVEEPVYVYDSYQEDDSNSDIITGALKILKKKVFDGVAFLAVRTDKIQIWWKKELDSIPILIAEAELVGQVWDVDQWRDRTFQFDGAELTKVNAGTADSHYRAFRIEDIPQLSVTDAVWGMDLWWDAYDVKFAFYADVPSRLIRIQWQARVRNAALAWTDTTDPENPVHHKGLKFSISDYAGESNHTSGNDPEVGWTWHRWIFEPDGYQCSNADSRIPGQRFQEKAGLYIDPYIHVEAVTNTWQVYCDGYVFNVEDDKPGIEIYDTGFTTLQAFLGFLAEPADGITYGPGDDPNQYAGLISYNSHRAVFRFYGWYYDGITPMVSAANKKIFYAYVYDDKFFIEDTWITDSTTITLNDDEDKNGLQVNDNVLTSVLSIYESSGAETLQASDLDIYPTSFVGFRSTPLNLSITVVYADCQGTATIHQFIDANGEFFQGWRNGTITEGTHKTVYAILVDAANRENDNGTFNTWATTTAYVIGDIVTESSLRYLCVENHTSGTFATDLAANKWVEYRMTFAEQWEDTTIADPITGDWASDLNMPINVGVDGFAADGALHIDPNEIDVYRFINDITRIKQNIVLHDWPFKTGTVASPTDHLLCHLKCNENAASANLADETANGADGTWSNVSDGLDRNTNTAGDSVAEIGRGRNLDTQDGTGYIEMAVGSGNTHDADFLAKGSIYITLKPNFAYDDATNQYVFHLRYDGSNYISIQYRAASDYWRMTVGWGGTEMNIDTLAFTSDGELQRQMVLGAVWDSDKDFVALIMDGQVKNTATNTGTPTASHPSIFHVGAKHDQTLPADMLIDEIKTFDECILPYGAYFTGNGEVDTDVAHADLTAFIKGDEDDTDSLKIGTGTFDVNNATHGEDQQGNASGAFLFDANTENVRIAYQNIEGPIEDKGKICFWYKHRTGTVGGYNTFFAHGATFGKLYATLTSTLIRMDYNSGTTSIATTVPGDGNWHFIEFAWEASVFVSITVDGILLINDTSVNAAPTWGTDDLWIGNYYGASETVNGYIADFYITNSPYTPQIWTAFGKPLHIPLIDKE